MLLLANKISSMQISREIKIGSLVILSIVALYWGVNYLKGKNIIGSTNSFYVVYQQVEDLQKSAPVYVRGYKVGVVDAITLDNNDPGRILVELAIDKNVKIPKTTVAEIYNADFMGTKAVRLLFTGSNVPATRGDTLLASMAASMLDDLSPITKKVDVAIQELTQTLVNINTILDAQTIDDIKGTLSNLNSASKNANYVLDQNKDRVSLILDQANQLVASLNSASDDVKSITTKFKGISDSLSVKKLNATLANLETSSNSLKNVMGRIDSREGTLGKLVYDPSLHNSLLKLTSSLDSLAEDLKKNPKRYVRLSLF